MSKQTLGDGPIEAEYREKMTALARLLDEVFNGAAPVPGLPAPSKKNGFVLLVFPFDEVRSEGRCNYISNARRDDIVIMLKEQIKRFEGQPEVRGNA
jgi:hypothetical protein